MAAVWLLFISSSTSAVKDLLELLVSVAWWRWEVFAVLGSVGWLWRVQTRRPVKLWCLWKPCWQRRRSTCIESHEIAFVKAPVICGLSPPSAPERSSDPQYCQFLSSGGYSLTGPWGHTQNWPFLCWSLIWSLSIADGCVASGDRREVSWRYGCKEKLRRSGEVVWEPRGWEDSLQKDSSEGKKPSVVEINRRQQKPCQSAAGKTHTRHLGSLWWRTGKDSQHNSWWLPLLK